IKELATRARDGKLTIPELQGGTFTITNGGIYGSLLSTPILNTPQVGILGMHNIQQRPVAVDGQVEIRPMMYIALSYDHRVVDGATSVQFLVKLKELLEDPENLLLEGRGFYARPRYEDWPGIAADPGLFWSRRGSVGRKSGPGGGGVGGGKRRGSG